ncbi:16S rRNA (cytosine(1402)-N(4))-methyltransferase [Corynebacterium sp. HMSC14B06]|uniref:16S rRNA (cytosine(1402)-N(4))-methyltransferase RsmH n=1 Tax=Corynebacterium sp. HMSC14B06 TaxID=1581098 RepID=UPI0008A589F0|nr:16S rRNA (cytosine(1402)-N(4))-methyltransferase RsmH [Corynebacterium sp. HMSC14B06]OFT70787.1 16S rRNA (cytosine(1402)-N(4))-methyltransferase [Corynebacterium sp. HMSC14B06]
MNGSAPADDRKSGEFGHVPVLLHRVTDLLRPGIEALGDDAVVVDGTLGAGGHTEYLLEQFPKLCVVGLDRDDNALRGAEQRLARFGDRFVAFRVRFDSLAEVLSGEIPAAAGGSGAEDILARAAEKGIAGALFDLGVSSMQLDQVNRGFAYRVDAPLDMRMDASQGITAADVLNTYSHGDIARILSTYGDERFAGKIASVVLREREKEPFTPSGRLVELLYETIPAASRRKGGHPAKRTFQALRIEVNRELEALENVLPQVCNALAVDGRAVFMSYQSLEDRIVKKDFAERVKSTTPPGLPMELPGHEPHFALITRGAEKASASEIEDNPRAAPVRVRCIERIRAD